MKVRHPILALAAVMSFEPISAVAQESSVYITQVNQGALLTNSRRPASPEVYSRILGNSSAPTSTRPTAAPDTLGVDLTTLNGNPNTVRNAVAAASVAGSGAGSLTNNVAVLNQFGIGNVGTIDQTGFNNSATTSITGDRNVTSQTQSGGSSNQSVIGVSGSDNRITSGQTGSGNSTNLSLVGSGYTINSQQNGLNLSYTLTSDMLSSSGKTITVEQTGVGSARNSILTTLPAGSFPAIPRR
ncbi:hypothetical protein [Methylorubrum sp. GM97]|uniref:hypothetical protein n=1 Tax=Methylorubrum sp. GM97 TaxID=2938232 RepID=UPI0021880540|nr:hypothetical protein [Methylorubrum sp. GM97]BDL41809.1 hypothetical protein MSPGM_43990 [Methylorubrum sp. GM97]